MPEISSLHHRKMWGGGASTLPLHNKAKGNTNICMLLKKLYKHIGASKSDSVAW
jgi:hypothetical protein